MSSFVLICWDGPEGVNLRNVHREAHIKYIGKLNDEGLIHCAGPIKNDAGDQSIGAMIVFEATDLSAARAIADDDPYVAGGVYKTVQVQPFRKAIPA